MKFPTKNTFDPRNQFYFFNFGFRSSTDFTLVVDILIKDEDLNPVCYHEMFILNEEDSYEQAMAFQKKFSLDPEKYRNINIKK